MNTNIDHSEAYAEVLEILKYIPQQDYDKIPKEVLNKLMGEANEKSTFSYNVGIPMHEQNVSEEAKQILASFKQKFWNE